MAEDETTAIYALIEKFTRETCATHLLNTNPEGDHDFSLPLDDFLRTVEKFSPKRPFFLERGPHYYVRIYYNAYMLEKREDAMRLASISSAMESKTRRMMGSLEGFLQFAKTDEVARTVASRLPISRFYESDLERTSRWKAYWKNIDVIEKAFWSMIAIHEIAREKVKVSRVHTGPGTEKAYWKHDLVYWTAHLWSNLFGALPSSAPDSRFAEFLESVWASIDQENEHPQNWERTIRHVVSGMKASKSKT